MIGIGDVVVCVDDSPCRCGVYSYKHSIGVITGKIYKVDGASSEGGIWHISLENVPAVKGHRRAIDIARFKPLRKADTSFTALIKRRRPVGVDA